mmetsp:Transcript_53873/g.98494  ORF Transcript_53873/g.98494 Transcript_53873/m.98494 type:complete len:264 (+) Transcript_53873:89-880(+)
MSGKPAATAKQRAIDQRLRAHVVGSAMAGAVVSVTSAFLVAYAIIDIERQVWAQWLYTIVYGMTAAIFIFGMASPLVTDATARGLIIVLCSATSLVSYRAPELTTASRGVRVVAFTVAGTGLGASLLLSTLMLVRVALEVRGILPEGGPISEGTANPQQLMLLGLCALAEGAYFGCAIGFLEEKGPDGHLFRRVALPHEAPAAVLPAAAMLGALCGIRLEQLRQRDDLEYVRAVELQVLGGGAGDEAQGETRALLDPMEVSSR